jgi:hypothetical protein
MSQSYLEIARQGKNHWWRYLLGILLILFFWFIIGGTIATGIFFAVLVALPIARGELEYSQLQQYLENFIKTPSVAAYVATNINFIFFGLGIFLTLKWLHQRKFNTLISADSSINIKRFLAGFVFWFVLQVIISVIDYFIEPENFVLTFNPTQWLLLVPCALILTPIQTSAEELFFRGYLLQGLGLITKSRLILVIITGLIFMFPHMANPEVARGPLWLALYYFSFGVFQSLITLKDNRLELALGVHAANNISVVFINTKDSALPAPAMWTINDPGDPKVGLIFFLLYCAIFYFAFFGRFQKRT